MMNKRILAALLATLLLLFGFTSCDTPNFIKEILFKLVVDEDKPLLYSDLKKSLFTIFNLEQTLALKHIIHLVMYTKLLHKLSY